MTYTDCGGDLCQRYGVLCDACRDAPDIASHYIGDDCPGGHRYSHVYTEK